MMISRRAVVIKSPQEIEIMRRAGRINALVLDTVKNMIQPGITTAALDRAASEVIRKHGGKPAFKGYPGPYPFPATITVSINEELVHGIPGKRTLKEGDIVSIDCGTILDGYVADSAFTIGVGKISPEAQNLLDVTEESLYLGISKMIAGNRVGDVSAEIQKHVEGHGYHVPREYTGHGVGREMHEGPNVPNYGVKGRGLLLRTGVTIALEPMVLVGTHQTRVLDDDWTVISVDRSLTAHFEHSVAVVDGDPLLLTVID
jgi:methionyl aminopeptidase